MYSISENDRAEQSSIQSVRIFSERYKMAPALKSANAYKSKGIPVTAIVRYLISLIYTGKSMYQDMRGDGSLAEGFGKDTVYRFLKAACVNWQKLLLSLAVMVVSDMDRLTSVERMSAFVIDDSVFPVPYAKKTELVSLVHDHAEKGKNKYKWGFRMLTLGWTDGASFVPLTFRHLASADKKNRRCEAKENLDKRSIAHRIRQEAVSKMTEVLLLHLQAAVKAGVKAKYVLFDSWYAYPATIQDVCAMGLQVVARVKDGNVKYLVGKTENGVEKKEKLTAKQIFTENRKRRGRSRYLLSVPIRLRCDKDGQETTMPAKLVYVRNRSKRNEWIALVSTDTTLSEDEIVALYGKRWDIEVFFKVCKSYLKLTGEFHQLSYDALTAHTTIVMIRYMILSAAKRTEQDPRSLGELFFTCYDEMADIKFEQSLILLISLLSEALTDSSLGLSEDQIMPIMDAFIGKLPANMRACLQPGFTKSK